MSLNDPWRRFGLELTDEILEQLIKASGFKRDGRMQLIMVIKCIAVNPETPVHVLNALAYHRMVEVLERVAENRNTPPEVLAKLAQHYSAAVRAAVADNPNVPEQVLWLLAGDESVDVRYQIAENGNLPRMIIESLTKDDNAYVAYRAMMTIKRLESRGVTGRIRKWSGGQEGKAASG
jgi:hypothetical protein